MSQVTSLRHVNCPIITEEVTMFELITIGYYGNIVVVKHVDYKDACFNARVHASIDGGTAWVVSAWGRLMYSANTIDTGTMGAAVPTYGGVAW
jgi:hypothetical protein